MTDLDFESAQLQLVTEALRAGPGTPQWRDALATLETIPGADEFKVLYTARERLASGREYRQIRPGAGFTRKVMDSIEQEETAAPAKLPAANLIAAISALVILGILAAVTFMIIPHGQRAKPDDLAQTYFVNTRAQSNFETELGMEWAAFGPLQVEAAGGLRPVLSKDTDEPASTPPSDSATTSATTEKTGYRGGGVIYERTMPAEEPFAIAATVRVPKPSEDLAVQVFIADDRNFSGDSATSAHELVWVVRGADVSVVQPDGSVAAQGGKVRAGQDLEVRIAVNRTQAAVEMNGKRLWTGDNQLDSTRPRIMGVRFLARGKMDEKDAPVVSSVRVRLPQKQ